MDKIKAIGKFFFQYILLPLAMIVLLDLILYQLSGTSLVDHIQVLLTAALRATNRILDWIQELYKEAPPKV